MHEERFFIVSWGRLGERFMPRLYTPSVQSFFERLWSARGARYLRDYIANGAYGVLPPGDSYAPNLPIKFVRSAELMPNLGIDLDACPQVAEEYFIPKARARKDDILLAVKGATIASKKSVAHVREDIGDAIVNGSIFRMHAKADVSPRLLAIALSSEFAKRQMKLGLVANNGVDYLDKTLIHKIVVPLPEVGEQEKLVQKYDLAATNAAAKSKEADTLLASIDDYLLAELDITLPPEPENTIDKRMFRTKASDLGGWRFDPHALEPDVEACREKTLAYEKTLPLRRLVNFVRQTTSERSDDKPYIGLENIEGNTGFLSDPEDDNEFGSASAFEKGDVLFPKLRPYLNKVYFAEMSGYCSTEFHVLRPHGVLPEFLSRFLRSKLIVRQTKHHMTGYTLPRLQTRDIERLLIPLPTETHQIAIYQEANNWESKARQLQREADAELERAKTDIEAILLGDAA